MIVILGATVLVGMFTNTFDTSTPVSTADYKLSGARNYARELITAVPLKAPSTAVYARPLSKVDATNPNDFEVTSYVDSQNGFGAMIRSYWKMRLRYTGSDDSKDIDRPSNWTITEFIFDGEKIK